MRRARNLSLAGVLVGLLASNAPAVVAQEGTVHTVAPDRSGDYETISAAIRAASAGDTILISPGTYVEHLEIDKDLTLSGEGDRADVVIEPPDDQAERDVGGGDTGVVLIWVEDADVTLEGFTLGPRFGFGIVIKGGTADIRDIDIPDTILVLEDAIVSVEDSELMLLNFEGPNETTIAGSTMRNGAFAWAGASATFADNEIINGPIVAEDGASITVVGNTFAPSEDEAGVVIAEPESTGYIVDNEFTGGWAGIILEYPVESTAERNAVTGAANGIVAVESGGVIRDNTIVDAGEYGIYTVGEGMTIEDNTVEGGRVGLFSMLLPPPAHPRATDYQAGPFVSGNTITGASHFGVLVEDAPAEISGNVICAERESLKIEGEANLVLGTNEICDAGAE